MKAILEFDDGSQWTLPGVVKISLEEEGGEIGIEAINPSIIRPILPRHEKEDGVEIQP